MKITLWVMIIFLTWALIKNVYDHNHTLAMFDLMLILWDIKILSETPNI